MGECSLHFLERYCFGQNVCIEVYGILNSSFSPIGVSPDLEPVSCSLGNLSFLSRWQTFLTSLQPKLSLDAQEIMETQTVCFGQGLRTRMVTALFRSCGRTANVDTCMFTVRHLWPYQHLMPEQMIYKTVSGERIDVSHLNVSKHRILHLKNMP